MASDVDRRPGCLPKGCRGRSALPRVVRRGLYGALWHVCSAAPPLGCKGVDGALSEGWHPREGVSLCVELWSGVGVCSEGSRPSRTRRPIAGQPWDGLSAGTATPSEDGRASRSVTNFAMGSRMRRVRRRGVGALPPPGGSRRTPAQYAESAESRLWPVCAGQRVARRAVVVRAESRRIPAIFDPAVCGRGRPR